MAAPELMRPLETFSNKVYRLELATYCISAVGAGPSCHVYKAFISTIHRHKIPEGLVTGDLTMMLLMNLAVENEPSFYIQEKWGGGKRQNRHKNEKKGPLIAIILKFKRTSHQYILRSVIWS